MSPLTFLSVRQENRAAIIHLARVHGAPLDTDTDRLVFVTEGVLYVEMNEGSIFIGPGSTFDAVFVPAGLRVRLVPAMADGTVCHVVTGERSVAAALSPSGVGPWKPAQRNVPDV